jgi:cobalt-zinc-cadmium efflux system outer membrane protein
VLEIFSYGWNCYESEEFVLKSLVAVLIAIVCLSSLPVRAETLSQTLTLDQAIQTAITNNPDIKAAQARLGVSQAAIRTAGTRLNPSIMSDNGIAEKTYRMVGIQQTFELGGKRKRRIGVTEAQRDVVLAEINTTLLDIRTNVRRAYAQLYNMLERQRTTQEILNTTERLLDVARKREHAGDISNLDVMQAEIVAVNARNDVQTVAYQVTEARNRLNSLLYQPLASSLILAPPTLLPQTTPSPVPPPSGVVTLQGSISQTVGDVEGLIQTALSHRPEVQQNLRNIEVTQRQLALARANRVPNLTLSAGPDLVTGNSSERAFNVYISGSLEIPLFNRQQGPIQEALARRVQLEREQAALKNRITLEVTNAYTAFLSAQDRVTRYETELLPKAQAVVEKSRRSFDEGKSSILVPINAQQAYINTQLGYLQALMDTQNAISDLERAVGTGL